MSQRLTPPQAVTMLALMLVAVMAAASTATAQTIYTTNAQFDTGVLNSVNHDVAGQLQLNTSSATEPFIWVANTDRNTVTKIDTRTGKQVAKYHSVLWSPALSAAGVPNPAAHNNNYPSRTAIDGDGNAFVSNRAFDYRASLTKFAGTPGECVDRNGNSTIETSTDVNGDGVIGDGIWQPFVAGEFLGQNDECILWTVPTLSTGDWGRSVAVDSNQDVWVAGFQTSKMEHRSGVNGALLATIDPDAIRGTDSRTYGLAVGPGGLIYTADVEMRRLRRVDPATSVVQELLSPVPTYGLAVDATGVTWQGGWTDTNAGGLVKADFATSTVTHFTGSPYCAGLTRGVAVDATGTIWVACYRSSRLLKYNSSGTLLNAYAVGSGPIGTAIDGDGNVWTSNQAADTLTRFNPTTAVMNHFYAGGPPYSYSDMTGFQQRNFTSQQGTWTVVQDGGSPGTPWGKVSWNNEPAGATPADTEITAHVRAADSIAGLAAGTFVPVSHNTLFSGINGQFIEVRMTLRLLDTSSDNRPILSDVTIAKANQAPTATCADVSVPTDPGVCTAATAPLVGTATDPEDGALAGSQMPIGPYSLGPNNVTFSAADSGGLIASCPARINVFDNQPPSILCPAPTTIECAAPGTPFTPGPASGADNCSVTVTNPGAGTFPLGTTTLGYSALDGAGASVSCSSAVTVVDTTAPVISSVTNGFASIWPPNHNMIPLNLTVSATDSCAGGSINTAAACRVTSITSNEAINSTGDGNTDPDWIIPASGLNASVRAERKGNGNGRVYTITVVCTDASGNNSAPATTTVAVPHSQSRR